MSPRTLEAGRVARILVAGLDDAPASVVLVSPDVLVEAPNWSLDARTLYVNGDGRLFAVPLADPRLVPVVFDGLPPINNDHVLDPDGVHIFLSADDGHVYRGALAGGGVTRVTPEDGEHHFLHGVSPDGERLAWVQLATFDEPGRLVVGPADGSGAPREVETGGGHLDGPEFSPDGEHLYLNTEAFTTAPGHAQLARMPASGGGLERLVTSETVDWFPHVAPDGRHATYVAFPAGTLGHPADRDVEVRVVATSDWSAPLARHRLQGGQGTLNVASWSPGSDRFAFVDYPRD